MFEEIVSPNRTPTPVYRDLSGFDRCDGETISDKKGCAAVAEITYASGSVHLCGHHTRLGMKKIRATAIEIWVEPAELFDADSDLRAQMEALVAVHRPLVKKAERNLNGFS
jgi:hypothetical protein